MQTESPVEATVFNRYGHDQTGHEHHVGAVQVVQGYLGSAGRPGHREQD